MKSSWFNRERRRAREDIRCGMIDKRSSVASGVFLGIPFLEVRERESSHDGETDDGRLASLDSGPEQPELVKRVDGLSANVARIVFADISCRLFRRALNGYTKSTRVCFVLSSSRPVQPSVRFRDRAPIVEVAASVVGVSGEREGGREKFPVTFPPTREWSRGERRDGSSDGINPDSSLWLTVKDQYRNMS